MSKQKMPAVEYVVAVGDQYVSTFTYPGSLTKLDKIWERSDGIKIAYCCKAILGKEPFRWSSEESAVFIAQHIRGAEVMEVKTCAIER